MKVVVFAGPTIDAATIGSFIDCTVRGPVTFGDVYRAAKYRPTAIVLIDGYFERVPAVWHKEILWAMSEGVHVFGCSSMGALRAAELADFGMVGVGEIFEAYRSGELEDDDEVAVAHRSAEDAYAPTSDALVNIRATLKRAVREDVVTEATAGALLRVAKERFYVERSYQAVLRYAHGVGVDPRELDALSRWLPEGVVDQKRIDALTLLSHLKRWCSKPREPMRVGFTFHATDAWREAARVAGARDDAAGPGAETLAALVEELKLDGSYASAWRASALRGASIQEAVRAGFQPDLSAVRAALEGLRDTRVPETIDDPKSWLAQLGMTDGESLRFLEDEARATWARPIMEEFVERYLLDHLRATASYARVVARCEEKRRWFMELGSVLPALAELGMSEEALWHWHFETQLGRVVPPDLHRYARGAGFRDAHELRSVIIRDYLFETRK